MGIVLEITFIRDSYTVFVVEERSLLTNRCYPLVIP